MATPRYTFLEQFRLAAAILVIALHTGLLADVLPYGYLLPAGLARLAVPYFATLSGYFVVSRATEQGSGTLRKWWKSVLRTYLVFFPLYVFFFVQALFRILKDSGGSVLPPSLFVVRSLLFDGYVFHMWYLPSIVYAVFAATWLLRRCAGFWVPALVGIAIYIAGSIATTYCWALPSEPLGSSAAASDHLRWLRFLYLLLPFVIGGALIRKAGETFTVRAAWIGLILGTAALVAETIFLQGHAGNPESMLSMPLVGLCGFRILVARANDHPSREWPYGRVSNLVYCYHALPILVFGILLHHHLPNSIAVFGIVSVITALLVALTLRTPLAKLVT